MSKPASWTTPDEIRQRLRRWWDSGRLLAERVSGTASFPLELPLRQPTVAELGERFDEVRSWIRALEGAASDGIGLAWREINHRQLGRNRVPDKAVIASYDDAIGLVGQVRQARQFERLAATTLERFPALAAWLARRPMTLLEYAADWDRVLLCLAWFVAHPRAGLYLRQLDIGGVDSKFIEARKALLAELLDAVLPPAHVDPLANGARQFERRYGLLAKPATVRFRLLDPRHALGGLTDVSTPVAQFAGLRLALARVYITENEINGLAFPPAPDAMVVFGGGYGIERLAQVPWLHGCEVVYWGDIDTHGFAILDRLRASLPHVRSLMMDFATLHAHRALWGEEEAGKRYLGELTRLSEGEQAVYAALRDDVLAQRLRMEQERIGFGWVEQAVRAGRP
ncbi:MAG: DUF3322 domain-containing protein [Gammaproteobacteria bacterium]